MRNILLTLILTLSIFYTTIAKSSNHKVFGEGDFYMEDWIIEYFQEYIQTKGGKHPSVFVVSVDGSYAMYWYCPTANCQVGDEMDYIKKCEIKSDVECKVFARKRYIKWKNGINPGKGKISKISSKLNFHQLKTKLTELGFVR